MTTYKFPDPSGGAMQVEAPNFQAAQQAAMAAGWTPSMGTFGADTGPDVVGQSYTGRPGSGITGVGYRPAPGQPGGGVDQPAAGGGGTRPATTSQPGGGGGGDWNQLFAALSQSGTDNYQLKKDSLELERQRLELDREKARSDMQLARNADARADAGMRLQQSDQALRQNQFQQSQLEFEQTFKQRQLEFAQNLLQRQREFEQSQLEFDKTFGQRQQEFRQTQYTDLAKSLLAGAAQLRGPRDWLQYAKFTGGGQDLYNQLYGSEGNAAFGGERGPSPNIQVGDVMGDLGFAPGGARQPGGVMPQVPLPHQINAAAWDRLAPATRELVLGAAEGGMTERGVYTPEDYQRILNASRPYGQASRTTRTSFAPTVGAF